MHPLAQVSSLLTHRQTRPQAVKHYESKVEYIGSNLETLQETIQKKQDNMNYLVNVMQSKLQSASAKNDNWYFELYQYMTSEGICASQYHASTYV